MKNLFLHLIDLFLIVAAISILWIIIGKMQEVVIMGVMFWAAWKFITYITGEKEQKNDF